MNGEDVSNLSHEDAVSVFYKAEEPITIHVLKRPAKGVSKEKERRSDKGEEKVQDDDNVTEGTQTEVRHFCIIIFLS